MHDIPSIPPTEALLIDLVHDLRQLLGNIGTSVYCLSLVNGSEPPRAHVYLRTIEQQVARASNRLTEARAELNRLRAQRAGAEEVLAFTNSSTSAVT